MIDPRSEGTRNYCSRSILVYRLIGRSGECVMVRCPCRLQETTVQVDSDRGVFLSTLPATGRDRTVALCRCRRLVGSVRVRRAVCRHAACPDSGFRCELSIRARDQRSDHRDPVVFAIRHFAVAGAAAACERLPVHRSRGDRPRPDLSRACSRRPGCSMPVRRPPSGSTWSGTADFPFWCSAMRC